jgi:energy-coupling factor transporter ATP-binding protein EcfA2
MSNHKESIGQDIAQQRIPYPGLRPFRCDEADLFFGRKEQLEHLLAKLSSTRFVAVTGASGCGKTSLIQAGLLPALERGDLVDAGKDWRIAIMRPGATPFVNLAEALVSDTALGKEAQASIAEVVTFLRTDTHSLTEGIREASLPKQTNFLLIVDQFEDLLRDEQKEHQTDIQAFIALLLVTANQRELALYIVITLRSEFMGDCAQFQGLPESLNAGQFLIAGLTREQQEQMIREPVRICSGNIEEQVVNRLLEDMPPNPDHLPIFQHCLRRLWLQAKTRTAATKPKPDSGAAETSRTDGIVMTLDDYEAIGRINHALSNHVAEAINTFAQPLQELTKRVFACFIAPQITPQHYISPLLRVHKLAALTQASTIDVLQVIEVLRHPDYGFIMPSSDVPLNPDSVVNVSYESLLSSLHYLSVLPGHPQPKPLKPTPTQKPHKNVVFPVILIVVSLLALFAFGQCFSTKQALTKARSQNDELQQMLEARKAEQQNVQVTDAQGATIPAVCGVYYVEAQEKVTLELSAKALLSPTVTRTYAAARGVVQPNATMTSAIYIAPNTSGMDSVSIRIVDKKTGGPIQEVTVEFKVY